MSGTDTSASSSGSVAGESNRDAVGAKGSSKRRRGGQPTRASLVAKRWLSVILCGIVAASVCLIAAPFLPDSRSIVIENLASLGWPTLMTVAIVSIFAAIFPSLQGRSLAFFGVRHFIAYPPVWVSAAIGGSILAVVGLDRLAVTAQSGYDATVLIVSVLALSLIGDLPRLVSERHRKKVISKNAPSAKAIRDFLDNRELFNKWLEPGHEISGVSDDLFGMDAMAKQIASLITMDGAVLPTIAVLGRVGSGKSSLGRLVRDELKANQDCFKMDFVQLSLCPYETVDAAAKAVLDRVIDCVSRSVPTLALRGISQRYALMMSDGSRIERLFAASAPMAEPKGLLERIDQVLWCVDRRLVLWVDDLERFSQGGDYAVDHSAGPIESLLYELDRCSRISLVVATTPEYLQQGDLKIATYHRFLAGSGGKLGTDICRAAARLLDCESACEREPHAQVPSAAGSISELKIILRETKRLVCGYRERFGSGQLGEMQCIDGVVYNQIVVCVTLSRIATSMWNDLLRGLVELPIVVVDADGLKSAVVYQSTAEETKTEHEKVRDAIRGLIAREKLSAEKDLFGMLSDLWTPDKKCHCTEDESKCRLFNVRIYGDTLTVSRSQLFNKIFFTGEISAFGGVGYS